MAKRRRLIDNAHDYYELPRDILMNVFSRLPVKSLVQLKSVSKNWYSVITNPDFAEFYHARTFSPRKGGYFLVDIPPFYGTHSIVNGGFGCVINLKDTASSANVFNLAWSDKLDLRTNIVDGLVCFYDGCPYKGKKTSLCNLTTREILPLPLPTRRGYIVRRSCFLGFDPYKKEYKVLCIWRNEFQVPDRVYCEVFTVGSKDNLWRPVDVSCVGSRFTYLSGQFTASTAFCHDGVLYWTSCDLSSNRRGKAIIVFNVQHEKFKFFEYPREEEIDSNAIIAHIHGHVSLVHLNLPLYYRSYNCELEITLWTLMDGTDNNKPLWTKQVTTRQFQRCFLTNFGYNCSGQVFSVSLRISDVSIDCYEFQTGNSKSLLRINNSHKALYDLTSSCVPSLFLEYVENITLLKNLGTQSG